MRLAHLVRPLWRLGTQRGASDPTVTITGSPRSGTTWLLEMIEDATGARRAWEPFHSPDDDPRDRNFGLGWRPYLDPEEEHPALERFLGRVLHGQDVPVAMATGSHPYGKVAMARRLVFGAATVVKFCRLQRLLPWFVQRFDVPVVLLIRNPLAVVASQLEHPGWDSKGANREHPVVCNRLRRDFPDLAEYALGLHSVEEKLAATWAFDYLIPLFAQQRTGDSVYLVRYEKLVRSTTSVLQEIVEYLELSASETSSLAVKRPSSTTREDSSVAKGKHPRSTWRRRLSDGQMQRILSVIGKFGFRQNLPEMNEDAGIFLNDAGGRIR